jgi:hypothetical protein
VRGATRRPELVKGLVIVDGGGLAGPRHLLPFADAAFSGSPAQVAA